MREKAHRSRDPQYPGVRKTLNEEKAPLESVVTRWWLWIALHVALATAVPFAASPSLFRVGAAEFLTGLATYVFALPTTLTPYVQQAIGQPVPWFTVIAGAASIVFWMGVGYAAVRVRRNGSQDAWFAWLPVSFVIQFVLLAVQTYYFASMPVIYPF